MGICYSWYLGSKQLNYLLWSYGIICWTKKGGIQKSCLICKTKVTWYLWMGVWCECHHENSTFFTWSQKWVDSQTHGTENKGVFEERPCSNITKTNDPFSDGAAICQRNYRHHWTLASPSSWEPRISLGLLDKVGSYGEGSRWHIRSVRPWNLPMFPPNS